VSASTSPDLGDAVAEPFRTDPDFWRSVCASADAVVLLVLAVAVCVLCRLAGLGPVVAWAPFVLPAVYLVRAAVSSSRFHHRHEPLPTHVDTVRGELSWRDAERMAVAAVFRHALVRGRLGWAGRPGSQT
jgi:hypothetical protein